MTSDRTVVYRDLHSLEELRRVVELEKAVWRYTDAEDVVPVPILAINVKRGGILIGAFDGENRMVGFVYSLPGLKDGQVMQWSHMLGVLDDYRNAGLGRTLKLLQRERALGMGVQVIEWTYDPMQAMNAHLNLAKLGAVIEEYEENIYGESSSALHRGTPTDRFVAVWTLESARVVERIATASPTEAWPADVQPMEALPVRQRDPRGKGVADVRVDRPGGRGPAAAGRDPHGVRRHAGGGAGRGARLARGLTADLHVVPAPRLSDSGVHLGPSARPGVVRAGSCRLGVIFDET